METRLPNANAIADHARVLTPRERDAFVQAQCGADATLISQVYELLQQNATLAEDVHETAVDWQPRTLLGTRLGPYELCRLLGSGGMGEVYLAQRVDTEFQQQVAIKLVRTTLLSKNVAARLRVERQILASLKHPNIATLFDGGSAADGTPYLVMEYIEGVNIDIYCDRAKLTIEQRLRLFCEVCAAVQYAHQNLIVHRDLKPTNILVTHDGQPKLLDFGIAKLLDTQLSARNDTLTHHDLRMFTPAHASPEQVRGEAITTRSDIYVLGVLLYELLCGRRPFVLAPEFRFTELERVVCTVRPPRPSVAVASMARKSFDHVVEIARARSTTVPRLTRRLQGDLDNMVMMALRKNPARRYASAEQFANDIQHWLNGKPVVATKPSWSYFARKFATRHAVTLSAISAAFLLLIGFSVLTYLQARDLARQRDAIAIERTRAEQVSSFLVDLFKFSDPTKSRGNELKARDLLDTGARHIDTALTAQPATRAVLLETIGEVYGSLGLNTEAADTLQKSLDARIKLYGVDNDEVAETLAQLGEVRISQGEYAAASNLLEQAVQIQQRLHGVNAVEQATALRLLSKVSLELGDFPSTEHNLLRTLALYDTHDQYHSLNKALALANLGDLRANQYRDAEAEALFRAALAITAPALGNDHPRVTELHINLADALESQGKYSEAQPLFEAALSEKRRVLGNEHPQTIDALENYGSFLRRKGDYAPAQIIMTEALQANIKIRGESNMLVGYDRVNLGLLDYDRGEYAPAEIKFRAALTNYAHSLPAKHAYIAGAQMSLGRALMHQGKLPEAIAILNQSIAMFVDTLGTDNPVTYRARAALGITLVAAQRYDEARPLLIAAQPFIESIDKTQTINRELRAALDVVSHRKVRR